MKSNWENFPVSNVFLHSGNEVTRLVMWSKSCSECDLTTDGALALQAGSSDCQKQHHCIQVGSMAFSKHSDSETKNVAHHFIR